MGLSGPSPHEVSNQKSDTTYEVNVNQRMKYSVSAAARKRTQRGALVDRGANGGICGDDALVIHTHAKTVDVTGIDNHQMTQLAIVNAVAKVETTKGPILLVLNNYAYHGTPRTIHSAIQIEAHKNKVDDRARAIGGKQCITTLEGYVIPLKIINGLPYMEMSPPTEAEADTLPQVHLTAEGDWNVNCLDDNPFDDDNWRNDFTTPQCDRFFQASPFDPTGNLKDEDRSNMPGSAEDSAPAAQGPDEEPTTVTLPKSAPATVTLPKPAPRPPPKPKGGTKP